MGLWQTLLKRIAGKRPRSRTTRFVSGRDVGGELCEALGLGKVAVQQLWINVPVDGVMTITAKIVGTEQQATELRRFLLEYRAVPAPEPAE